MISISFTNRSTDSLLSSSEPCPAAAAARQRKSPAGLCVKCRLQKAFSTWTPTSVLPQRLVEIVLAMGRKKIQITRIVDERNRQVSFCFYHHFTSQPSSGGIMESFMVWTEYPANTRITLEEGLDRLVEIAVINTHIIYNTQLAYQDTP